MKSRRVASTFQKAYPPGAFFGPEGRQATLGKLLASIHVRPFQRTSEQEGEEGRKTYNSCGIKSYGERKYCWGL
jgi:hypothetical protein